MTTDWYNYPTNYTGGNKTISGVWDFFFGYPSEILNGWFSLGIVFLIFVSSFGISLYAGTRKALATASFITFIFSIYFFMRGILNPIVPIVLIILTIIGAIGSKEEGGL